MRCNLGKSPVAIMRTQRTGCCGQLRCSMLSTSLGCVCLNFTTRLLSGPLEQHHSPRPAIHDALHSGLRYSSKSSLGMTSIHHCRPIWLNKVHGPFPQEGSQLTSYQPKPHSPPSHFHPRLTCTEVELSHTSLKCGEAAGAGTRRLEYDGTFQSKHFSVC